MQILSPEQMRAWDAYTIHHEPIASLDLMERAAQKCLDWIERKNWNLKPVLIFCGKGNNGGDGLAIGRLLHNLGYEVSIYILEFGKIGSDDFQANLQRLHALPFTHIFFIQEATHFPALPDDALVIDAVFGSGLNKPLDGLAAELVRHINKANSTVVSIDLPSGLFSHQPSIGYAVVEADHTLTFQCYKQGLLMQENAAFIGEVSVLAIGLHPAFLQQQKPLLQLLDETMIRKLFRPRSRFAHKGRFGHALIVGGSYGKMGAAVLAVNACLRSGAGLTTAFIPKCGYHSMQTTLPEAMAMMDEEEAFLTSLPDEMDRFNSIGIGPGLGTRPETQRVVSFVLRRQQKPLVVDADGLNCVALNKELLQLLPAGSTLTPHPKEFDRLFGDHPSDFDRIETAKREAAALQVIIVLKGHHTFIATPSGVHFFNSTGNAGLAKGGSGDVLTGILTSLLAQGYPPADAARLGVYVHGWAGDVAAKNLSQEAMLPSDLIDCLATVFLVLTSPHAPFPTELERRAAEL